jgi:hypothetical protein
MKKIIILSSVFSALLFGACSNSSTKSEEVVTKDSTVFHSIDTMQLAAGTEYYQCPMDPSEVSDRPAKCPKCGMDLEKVVKH